MGAQEMVADSLKVLGEIWLAKGAIEEALPFLDEALLISRGEGDQWIIGDLLNDIGAAYCLRAGATSR
jgi:hypothetical protein